MPDGAGYILQIFYQFFGMAHIVFDVGYNVANCLVCFQVLTQDVNVVFGQYLVDVGQNTGYIIVYMH